MEKLKLEIYDPPMCCSSGVCGPNVNSELVQFSSDLEWLKSQNVEVERFGLSSDPAAFTRNEFVRETLKTDGNDCLPIILVNGTLVSKGRYPTRDELKAFLGIESDDKESLSEDKNPADCCGPGCDCGKPSGNNKYKAVICILVLLMVGGIFAYKAVNGNQAAPVDKLTAFAAPVASTIDQQKPDTQQEAAISVESNETAVQHVDEQKSTVKTVKEQSVGDYLDSLAALNKLAVNQDAVFVFLPAKGSNLVSKEITDAIASAKQKIEAATGAKLGLYTLKSGSQEYANIAAQLPLPGMLVMSKGRGMGAVSGGITEEKILQAYVASSSAGCGPSGCGPSSSGCGPAPIGPRR